MFTYLQDVGRVSGQESSPTARTTDCAYKTQETLVLYDQCSRSVADDVIVSTTTSQMTSYHVVSVLLRRLKQDGFRVYLLDGKPRVVLNIIILTFFQRIQLTCSTNSRPMHRFRGNLEAGQP